MPVPDTRRLGGREESSYSYTTRTTGRSSYLPSSTYTTTTSKYSSTLPPRPYERKSTDYTSSMPTSRFLPSRTSSTYGSTSTSLRTSISPVRTSYARPSVTDRIKSLEPDSVIPSSRFSRARDTSASVNSKFPSTYTGYTRDRSGSRELGTSPLTGSSVSFSARETSKNPRSSSIGPTSSSAPTTRTSAASRTNGLPRLASVEVSQSSSSSSSNSSVCSGSGGEGSSDKCKDVENNDSFNCDVASAPLIASSVPSPPTTITTTPTTSVTTTTTTTSALASHPRPGFSGHFASTIYSGAESAASGSSIATKMKPVVITELNQDTNGNPIVETMVNGHGSSGETQGHSFKSKKEGSPGAAAGKLPSSSKLTPKGVTGVSPPKVIYHKIHVVDSEGASVPARDKVGQAGSSTAGVAKTTENGESTAATATTLINGQSEKKLTGRHGKTTVVDSVDSMQHQLNANVLDGKMKRTFEDRTTPPPGVSKLIKSKENEAEKLGEGQILSPPEKSSDANRNEEPEEPEAAVAENSSNICVPNGENHNVEMAGPHASKYRAEETPGTSAGTSSSARRGGQQTNGRAAHSGESDSSENDSDAYNSSPQLGGRFRSREKDSQAGLTGLRNIGNTCFMNSVLQCLSNTKPLLEYLLTDNYISDINSTSSSMKGALIRAFANVIQELWRESRTVDTSAFKDQIQRFAPRFMGYSQQDAQEFLRYLLEGLHEEINRVTVKPKPILTDIDESLSDAQKAMESWKRYLRSDDSKIVDIFVGQFKSTLKCTTCGHCSVTFDPFWDLSLPIPSRSNTTKLSQCLELFAKEETLDGDEKPTCAKCQTRRKCTKSLSIQRFPKVLVIHLKRFAPAERFRGKLSTTVEFPLNGLDMTPYAANRSQGCSYNLYGISNHSGSTYSGHYIAYCKHPKSGEWNIYNDSRVSPISSQSVAGSEGYVLFYELANQSSHL